MHLYDKSTLPRNRQGRKDLVQRDRVHLEAGHEGDLRKREREAAAFPTDRLVNGKDMY